MGTDGKVDQQTSESLSRLNGLLENRLRLGVCVLLARTDELTFSRLKELLEATDGNLGAQVRKLEDEGYVAIRKEFRERRPTTWYCLTDHGRQALDAHLRAMQDIVATARRPAAVDDAE